MPPLDDGAVSHREFDNLRTLVHTNDTELAVQKSRLTTIERTVQELTERYRNLPIWLMVMVGLGFPTLGLLATLFLARFF